MRPSRFQTYGARGGKEDGQREGEESGKKSRRERERENDERVFDHQRIQSRCTAVLSSSRERSGTG